MKRVLVIIGTRPEAIKLAPVVHALVKKSDDFETRVCLTAQHREMIDQLVNYFGLRSDYDLNIMKKGQTLSELTGALTYKLQDVFTKYKPEFVLVQGDTTSAFIAALAGYYHRTQVGHVEAGLRTYNKYAPFPEELNRRLISILADHHFAPTDLAKAALLREGVNQNRIIVTGNTVIDALHYTIERINKNPPLMGELSTIINDGRKIVLITGHRRENFGEGFKNICEAILQLAKNHHDCAFIYPVHLNPNVQRPVYRMLGSQENIFLIPPMDYVPFVRLMSSAYIVLTDSGGIQEEAPSLGIPVLVMRNVTERPEGVEAGTAQLVGHNISKIVNEVNRLLNDRAVWETMSQKRNPYGDGKASERIIAYLKTVLNF